MTRAIPALFNMLFLVAASATARAADAPASTAEVARLQADLARLQADVARLQQDLRDQKQLLLNVMQSEQQRYEVLMQLVRSLAGGGAAQAGAAPDHGALLPALPATPSTPGAKAKAKDEPPTAATGSITGKVALPGASRAAFVYVEGLRGGGGRGRVVEINQKDKQFSPQVVAVPVGTRLVFPNFDNVFHNVFSKTPGAAFDAGSVKGGEKTKAILLSKPGHMEVFCNIHSKMRADILVVPNGYFARVADNGSFQISGVPVGPRRVVLWGPDIKPSVQVVDVSAAGSTAHFTAQKESLKPHSNKFGQVYGSYDE